MRYTLPGAAAARLQALLGRDKLLRDFATFTTERGEPAALLLYVTHAHERSEIESCLDGGGMICDDGIVWLDGNYSVALVVGGQFVNSVQIPELGSLPLMKYRSDTSPLAPDRRYPRPDELERVKLIELAHYNGDSDSWEFRLQQYEDSSDQDTMLAGYSARQRKAVLYPIISGKERNYWHVNLFPSAAHASKGRGRFRYNLTCGFMGSSMQVTEEFTYDADQEAWVRTRLESRDCEAVDGMTRSRPYCPRAEALFWFDYAKAWLDGGTARATIDVHLRTSHSDLTLVMMDVMFDPQLAVLQSADGHPSCRIASSPPGATFWFNPPRCVSSEEGLTCQPATEVSASIPVALKANEDTLLFRCDIQVDRNAVSGWYQVWADKVRVFGANGASVTVDGVNDLTSFVEVEQPF